MGWKKKINEQTFKTPLLKKYVIISALNGLPFGARQGLSTHLLLHGTESNSK